eukprot:TRINITY_DN9730_c0_g1_i2.p1 TRINITY_DN9730_c0_g1~~TRINITY_DN9730_c0_g1_i2.p1  ORF type:complete len:689 (+),score=126.38 TRINITY_DN9730_c0_g1_i2:94-2160(+)
MDEHMDEEHVGYPRGERSSWIWSGCSVMGALCAVHLTWICLFLIAFFLAGLLSFLGATASISIPIVIFVFSFFFCCFVIMNNDFMAHEQGEENDEGPTTIAKRISAVLGDMTEASAEKRESRRLSRSSSRNSRNSGSGEMIGAGSGMARTSTFSDQEGIVSRWQVEFAEEGDLSIGLIKSRVEESWCDFDEERQNLFLAAVLSNTNHVTYENDGHVYEVDLSVNRKSGVLQIPDMGISRRLRLVHVRPTTDQQTHSAPLITLPAAPSQEKKVAIASMSVFSSATSVGSVAKSEDSLTKPLIVDDTAAAQPMPMAPLRSPQTSNPFQQPKCRSKRSASLISHQTVEEGKEASASTSEPSGSTSGGSTSIDVQHPRRSSAKSEMSILAPSMVDEMLTDQPAPSTPLRSSTSIDIQDSRRSSAKSEMSILAPSMVDEMLTDQPAPLMPLRTSRTANASQQPRRRSKRPSSRVSRHKNEDGETFNDMETGTADVAFVATGGRQQRSRSSRKSAMQAEEKLSMLLPVVTPPPELQLSQGRSDSPGSRSESPKPENQREARSPSPMPVILPPLQPAQRRSRKPSSRLQRHSAVIQVSMGGGKWVDFDQAQQAQFHAAKANGQATVSFKLRHDNYEARFATLEQVNLKTGRSRAIREISNAGVASEDFDDAELAGDMDETKPDPIRVSSFQSRTL